MIQEFLENPVNEDKFQIHWNLDTIIQVHVLVQ